MINIRKFNIDDLNWLVELNNSCVPAVNFQTAEAFTADMPFWHTTAIVTKDDKPLGIVILLREGTDYKSKNYAWHNRNNAQHLYVDRIIVSEQARGLGVGRKLYDFAINEAVKQQVPLTAEVNTQPNNPQSHAFHESLGFKTVGEHAHAEDYSVRFYKYES